MSADLFRGTGRTLRTCLKALHVCSGSREGELTVVVSAHGREGAYQIFSMMHQLICTVVSGAEYDGKSLTVILPGNRKVRSISVGQCQSPEITKAAHQVIYDHSVRDKAWGD